MLANLTQCLRVGGDHQLAEPAFQRLFVEPLGDRRAVRELVDVGAAAALPCWILVARPGG